MIFELMDIANFKLSLCKWAQDYSEILAIAIVGSYARGAQLPGSDVDLIVVSSKPDKLLQNHDWMNRFGKIKSCNPEDYGLVKSLRCISNEDVEIEFGITSKKWYTPPIDAGTAGVINNSMLIVYDPDSKLQTALDWLKNQ